MINNYTPTQLEKVDIDFFYIKLQKLQPLFLSAYHYFFLKKNNHEITQEEYIDFYNCYLHINSFQTKRVINIRKALYGFIAFRKYLKHYLKSTNLSSEIYNDALDSIDRLFCLYNFVNYKNQIILNKQDIMYLLKPLFITDNESYLAPIISLKQNKLIFKFSFKSKFFNKLTKEQLNLSVSKKIICKIKSINFYFFNLTIYRKI